MHIPDGYLGPLTCAVMFIVMLPIWYLAFRSAEEKLGAKEVPMLAVLSAVSFLVMMFNWPVPDGTTAHMVGGTLIAIILGPWAAVIGVTVALVIQAFFFGDGGILALGANCFNMAFVLPFVGYYTYRLLEGRVGKTVASGIAAYIAINVAAICAAIEFGIQPYIAPGYCPYGLNLSIPAMAFAHLTTAGPVAGVVTAVVIAYLQKSRADLLELKKLAPGVE
ncbi:MAG TPA: cobalt transporter CbiM [Candidatus Syntrophoarchaeum butanivorans]|uniref:Cobalt transporter CbiM n=1 Tax=Candidatus Syntropharchaeum butanivorans TaxID=1839936 RepID=A0A7J2S0S9_9EURY|nr:cobalt transporter CbiM [Candidatus Syntrophoarchaeum butanivorans]